MNNSSETNVLPNVAIKLLNVCTYIKHGVLPRLSVGGPEAYQANRRFTGITNQAILQRAA